MKQFLFVLTILFFQEMAAQINLSPYEMTIESARAFEPANESMEVIDLSFHAQKWPIEVLRYTMYRLQQNPYISASFFIQVTIVHPDQSKKIIIPVPVNARYIEAFKTREGFDEKYVDFLSDTYEWMLEGL